MFGITLKVQQILFAKSIGLGFLFALLYNLIFHLDIKNKTIRAIADVLFFSVISLLSFVFCLEYNFGEGRMYLLAGELIGGSMFYCFPAHIIKYLLKKFPENQKNS